jgi:hypothetical protein
MAVDKHINFFELEKACEKPGCPLCRIVGDRAERYIDNMLFEHVSDRVFRKAHRLAGGFCNYHSRNLESFRDGLAVAILGRDILEERLDSFKKRRPWRRVEPWPICVERDRIETEYLGFLAGAGGDSAEEQELERIFVRSEGLCAPHYGRLLEFKKPLPLWLTECQDRKFEDLKRRIDRFIELSAYGRQEEFRALPEQDKLVWKELALALRGNVD